MTGGCSNLVLGQRITVGERNKQADSFHWRGLLRPCGKRPRDRCASDNNNKLPPPHICPQIRRGTVTANLAIRKGLEAASGSGRQATDRCPGRGQKRKSPPVRITSALPPKTDMD